MILFGVFAMVVLLFTVYNKNVENVFDRYTGYSITVQYQKCI